MTAPAHGVRTQALALPVVEVFGPTIQGEGLLIGRKTMFVRTAGCDYRCIWCDSKFTWDGSERPQWLTPDEVWERLTELGGTGFDYVTLSGGNPALLGDPAGALVKLLHQRGVRVGVETQGSRWQPWLAEVDDVTLSPKPPSSGMDTDWRRLDELVERLMAAPCQVVLKVVVFDDADYRYAKEVHRRWPDVPLVLSVGNPHLTADMPADSLAVALLARCRELAERVARDPELADVRVLPQLHVLLWGNRRGV
jgi:7-carboxy-7-deazaguanine synthase